MPAPDVLIVDAEGLNLGACQSPACLMSVHPPFDDRAHTEGVEEAEERLGGLGACLGDRVVNKLSEPLVVFDRIAKHLHGLFLGDAEPTAEQVGFHEVALCELDAVHVVPSVVCCCTF